MVVWDGVLALCAMGLAAAAAVAGHMAQRPPTRADDGFPSTILGPDTVRFRIEPMEDGLTTDCCSVAELIEKVGERRGQVLRVVDLEAGEDEYVEVMQDGTTWYPWASRHRVDLNTRFAE